MAQEIIMKTILTIVGFIVTGLLGYFVAKIKNGETKTFPIYYGAHRIELKQHMNYGYKD